MAGHSKWSKVKHTKGPLNVKRGVAFSKLVKEATVAARTGGHFLSGNPRSRSLVDTARAASLPKENIERAVQRGAGEPEGAHYEETLYESCARGGVAMVIEAATNHKNRTVANLRFIFSKNGGSLAASGSVLYQFHKKGRIKVPRPLTDGDRILEPTLDAGAAALHGGGVATEARKHPYPPDTVVLVDHEGVSAQVLMLYEVFDPNRDILNVYSNFDIPENILARLSA